MAELEWWMTGLPEMYAPKLKPSTTLENALVVVGPERTSKLGIHSLTPQHLFV
jgi:hypothetical protein